MAQKNPSNTQPLISLHSFAGYQLVQVETNNKNYSLDVVDLAKQRICQIDWDPHWLTVSAAATNNPNILSLVDILHDTLLACEALDDNRDTKNTVEIQFSIPSTNSGDCGTADCVHPSCGIDQCCQFLQERKTVIENDLARRCSFSSCCLSWMKKEKASTTTTNVSPLLVLRVESNRKFFDARDIYKVQKYQCLVTSSLDERSTNNNTTTITAASPVEFFIRERMSRQNFSLHELVSHQQQQVDNTGNVCIWDAEKTLTWVLVQERNLEVQTVLELGIGMAGMAGLAMAQRGSVKRIILTDGHEQCIQNNRINVRLSKAFFRHTSCDYSTKQMDDEKMTPQLECQVLLWTLQDNIQDSTLLDCADLTLISDCTHFEHYHGHLLWTLLQCTKPKLGQIWMCQPERGKSLQRFLDLIDAVNTSSETCGLEQLVEIKEPYFPHLQELHDRFMGLDGCTKPDPYYRPNVHKPRILILRKLRPLCIKQDRSAIISHLDQRQKTS